MTLGKYPLICNIDSLLYSAIDELNDCPSDSVGLIKIKIQSG